MNSGASRVIDSVGRLAAGVIVTAAACAAASASEGGLAGLMDLLSQRPSIDARFVERKHLRVLDEPLIVSGRLRYERGGRIERHTLVPYDERYVITNGTLIIEAAGENTTRTLSLEEHPVIRAFADSLRAMLGGDAALLKAHNRVEFEGALAAWVVTLRPRDQEAGRRIASIRFSGSGADIAVIELKETSGDRSLMSVLPPPG